MMFTSEMCVWPTVRTSDVTVKHPSTCYLLWSVYTIFSTFSGCCSQTHCLD